MEAAAEEASGRLAIAYSLLPPPLAALPAKYWTAASLVVHSYSVATMFSVLVDRLGETGVISGAPDPTEAFIIGFIHDFGQKLSTAKGGPELGRVERWIASRLEEMGFKPWKAGQIARYVRTNPAETGRDPLYSREVWELLRLADLIHSTSSLADAVSYISRALGKIDRLSVKTFYISASIPQPHIRSALSYYVAEQLEADEEPLLTLASPVGLLVVAPSNPNLDISWRDFVSSGLFNSGFIDSEFAQKLVSFAACCRDENCVKSKSGKGRRRLQDPYYGFKKKDCVNVETKGISASSAYELVALYYGDHSLLEKIGVKGDRVVLPSWAAGSFTGLEFVDVEFIDGDVTCIVCGLPSPVAATGGFALTLAELSKIRGDRVKPEKWNRNTPPVNLNQLLGNLKGGVGMCPLCIGDYIAMLRMLHGGLAISASINTFIHVQAVRDLSALLAGLTHEAELAKDPEALAMLAAPSHGFNEISELVEKLLPSGHGEFYYDFFSAKIFSFMQPPGGPGEERVARLLGVAGLLVSWGLYPLSMLEYVPPGPSNLLLDTFMASKPFYSFDPSDREVGGYTPYVGLVLASLPRLKSLKDRGYSPLPAVLDVLDYPPSLSAALLQYASPQLYSRVSILLGEVGGL